ncbi:MAG: hypothetical protein R2865_01955 [Deinococcales bacterium]
MITGEETHRLTHPISVDAIITESTYGDTVLPGRKKQVKELITAVKQSLDQRGRFAHPDFCPRTVARAYPAVLNTASGIRAVAIVPLSGWTRAPSNRCLK